MEVAVPTACSGDTPVAQIANAAIDSNPSIAAAASIAESGSTGAGVAKLDCSALHAHGGAIEHSSASVHAERSSPRSAPSTTPSQSMSARRMLEAVQVGNGECPHRSLAAGDRGHSVEPRPISRRRVPPTNIAARTTTLAGAGMLEEK